MPTLDKVRIRIRPRSILYAACPILAGPEKTRSIIKAKEAYIHGVHRICHQAFLSASQSANKLSGVSQTSPGYSARTSHSTALGKHNSKPANGSCSLACKLQTCKSLDSAVFFDLLQHINAHTGLDTSRSEVEAGLKGLF